MDPYNVPHYQITFKTQSSIERHKTAIEGSQSDQQHSFSDPIFHHINWVTLQIEMSWKS